MNGPPVLLLVALVALAVPSSASAADLVIKVRNKRVSALGGSKRWTTERGLHVGDPTARVKRLYPGATLTVSYFWLYKAYDSFVQGEPRSSRRR